MKKAVALLILVVFILIPLIAIGYFSWEAITNALEEWVFGENMMRKIQYWLTPWTISNAISGFAVH